MTFVCEFSEVPTNSVPSPPVDFTISASGSGTTPTFKLTNLDGWYSSGFKAGGSEGDAKDGGYASRRAFRKGRSLVLEGFVYGVSAANVVTQGWEFLTAMFPKGAPKRLVVTDDSGVPKYVTVFPVGDILVVPFRGNAAKFTVSLYAPDPHRYSTAVQTVTLSSGSTGSAFFVNDGNADAKVMVRATTVGTTGQFSIIGPGSAGSLSYSASAASSVLFASIYDYGPSAVEESGAIPGGIPQWIPSPGRLKQGSYGWPTIKPGQSVTFSLNRTNVSALRLQVVSTWW